MKISLAPTVPITAQPHPDGDARLPESSPMLSVPHDNAVNQRVIADECANIPQLLAAQRQSGRDRSPKKHGAERCELLFQLDSKLGLPKQWVTLTDSLQQALAAESDRSASNLVRCALERRPEHLTNFSRDALNIYNARYYETQGAFRELPPTYTRNAPVALAFASHMDRIVSDGPVRIKEVCAGEGALDRWKAFFALATEARPVEVCLADLSFATRRGELEISHPHVQGYSEAFNMLADLQGLQDQERIDCMVACYGFDSVWFPEDRFIMKHDDRWYEALYRVGIPDVHRERSAIVDSFLYESAVSIPARQFAELVIERAVCEFNLDAHTSLAASLRQRLQGLSHGSLSVPGGLVRWVTEAFAKQIKSSGRMLIADVGIYDSQRSSVGGLLDTGCPAQGRVIDFSLAEVLLETAGFAVTVRSLEDFVQTALGAQWREFGSDDENAAVCHPHQYIMEVARRS